MKKEIKDLWVADLRTNPPQGRHRLFTGDGHCCLGRLCVLAGLEPDENHKFDGADKGLPASVREWAGIKSAEAFVPTLKTYLSCLNDRGESFPEIADIIDKHWEEL